MKAEAWKCLKQNSSGTPETTSSVFSPFKFQPCCCWSAAALTMNTEQVCQHNAALPGCFLSVQQHCAYSFPSYSPPVRQSMPSTKPHFQANSLWLFDITSTLLRVGCKCPCVSFSSLLAVLLFHAPRCSKAEWSILSLTIWPARCLL